MHSLDVFALIFCQKQVVVMQEEKEVEVAEYDDEYKKEKEKEHFIKRHIQQVDTSISMVNSNSFHIPFISS
jgi:hypothetical protein